MVAGEVALGGHHLLGRLLGSPDSVVAGNEHWLVVAAILGAPLGLIGAAARQPGLLGLLAGLVMPVGLVAEPLLRGMLTPFGNPADKISSVVGTLLLLAGLVMTVGALWHLRERLEAS